MVRHRKEIICYPAKKNVNEWHIKSETKLGKGYFSTIVQVCKKSNCNYVMKLIKHENFEDIKKEVRLQNTCAKHGICLPVEEWWLCPNSDEYGGVIISPILDQNLEQYIDIKKKSGQSKGTIRRDIWSMMKKALKLILELHQLDIVHRNIKLSHFMLDKNGRMYLIDMREGKPMREGEEKLIYMDYATMTRSEYDNYLHFDILLGIGDKISDKVLKSSNSEHELSIKEAEEKVINGIINMTYQDTEEYSRETRNTYPEFVGISGMKEALRTHEAKSIEGAFSIFNFLRVKHGNLEKFKDWALNSEWAKFDERLNICDPWMFPINKYSYKEGWDYVVFESDIQELKQDQSYIEDYTLGAKLLIKSWGWNLKTDDFYPRPGKNQEWRGNDVRLKKLSLSLKLFHILDLFEKLKKFAIYLVENNMIFDPNERKEIIEIFDLGSMVYFSPPPPPIHPNHFNLAPKIIPPPPEIL